MMTGSCKFIGHNNSLCNCIATPKDIIMHLKNTDKSFDGVNLYRKKCYCGHAYSVHCLQTQSKISWKLCFKKFLTMIAVSNCFKVICSFLTWLDIIALDQSFVNKEVRPLWMTFLINKFEVKATGFNELWKKTNWLKQKYLTTVKMKLFLRFLTIVKNDCFSCITSFLTLKEMSVVDRAFVNKEGRHLWNLFLKEKYEFNVVGYNQLSQLWKIAKWLNLKKCSATLLQMKYLEPGDRYYFLNGIYDNRNLIHATLLNSRLKELIVEMAENRFQNQYCCHFIVFASHKCKNLCTLRLIFPESRKWDLKYHIIGIVNECLNLSEIYIENIKVNEINDLCTILGASERKVLKVLSLHGERDDHASVTSLNSLRSSHLHTLILKQIHLCNTDLNNVVNNIKTLKILNVINVYFNDKLLSNWMSTSVEEFIFHNCCYIVNNEILSDYGYGFRCLENVLYYLKFEFGNDSDSESELEDLFETVTKHDDKLEDIMWPIYNESIYIDIKMEFLNIYLPNLNTLNVNKDSLVTEESVISQIIQKGNNLNKIYIFNWHCTDASLDSIGDSCPNLSTIGLYVDDLRMTKTGLKRLIDKCLQLKYIIFHDLKTENYDLPDKSELKTLFQDTFQTRNIQCYWDDLSKDKVFSSKIKI